MRSAPTGVRFLRPCSASAGAPATASSEAPSVFDSARPSMYRKWCRFSQNSSASIRNIDDAAACTRGWAGGGARAAADADTASLATSAFSPSSRVPRPFRYGRHPSSSAARNGPTSRPFQIPIACVVRDVLVRRTPYRLARRHPDHCVRQVLRPRSRELQPARLEGCKYGVVPLVHCLVKDDLERNRLLLGRITSRGYDEQVAVGGVSAARVNISGEVDWESGTRPLLAIGAGDELEHCTSVTIDKHLKRCPERFVGRSMRRPPHPPIDRRRALECSPGRRSGSRRPRVLAAHRPR